MAEKVPCFYATGSLISREEQNIMAQIEKTTKLLRLSDTELTIANPAEDIRDRTVVCLLYTSPSPRDRQKSRMPSSA